MNKSELLTQAINIKCSEAKLEGKQEMFDKVKPTLDQYEEFQGNLREHIKKQNEFLVESFSNYNEGMIICEKKAKEFCLDKTSEQLKEFLADRPCAFNLWKNASHDELNKLVMEIYDDLYEEELLISQK